MSGQDNSIFNGPTTFSNVLQRVFSRYANGKGRSSRSEYWYFQLWLIVGWVAVWLLAAILSSVQGGEALAALASLAYLTFVIGAIVPSVTLTVRRLHDTGKSAHYLWFAFLPLVGGIVLLVFTLQESDPGQNIYGNRLD